MLRKTQLKSIQRTTYNKLKRKAEGMQKGELRLLMRLLEKNCELPPDFVSHLQQADEKQILLWSDRILTADKLSDILSN